MKNTIKGSAYEMLDKLVEDLKQQVDDWKNNKIKLEITNENGYMLTTVTSNLVSSDKVVVLTLLYCFGVKEEYIEEQINRNISSN